MVVRVASVQSVEGTHTPSALNTEETVIEVVGDGTHWFMVEGEIDLSAMQSGDEVQIVEYHAVDGTNYQVYAALTLTYDDVASDPVLHFHMKTFSPSKKFKITLNQTTGTVRSFPYSFVVEQIEQVT